MTFRMTSQRKIILDELCSRHDHPSAEDIYFAVRQRLPRISLGTVYRNLEIMSFRGVIRKIEISGNQKRFDCDVRQHHHIRCEVCGRVDDVTVENSGVMDSLKYSAPGYRITGYNLIFAGICEDCQKHASPIGEAGAQPELLEEDE